MIYADQGQDSPHQLQQGLQSPQSHQEIQSDFFDREKDNAIQNYEILKQLHDKHLAEKNVRDLSSAQQKTVIAYSRVLEKNYDTLFKEIKEEYELLVEPTLTVHIIEKTDFNKRLEEFKELCIFKRDKIEESDPNLLRTKAETVNPKPKDITSANSSCTNDLGCSSKTDCGRLRSQLTNIKLLRTKQGSQIC